MLPERHASVVGHSKCSGRVGVGNGCVVKSDSGLCCVFAGPGCDECKCGFGG